VSFTLEERRGQLQEAITGVETQIDENATALRAAPPWFRPDLRANVVAPAERPVAVELTDRAARLAADQELLARLRGEVDDLSAGRLDLARCAKQTLEWLNAAMQPSDLIAAMRDDPLDRATGRPFELSEELADRIIRYRDEQLGGAYSDLAQLEEAEGVDRNVVWHLLYAGCWHRPPVQPPPVPPTVAVLLPVRLETRFYPPAGTGGWKLRVRVVPDAPSIDRHDPLVTSGELDDLDELWAGAAQGLATVEGRAAWRRFVDRHGASRATWLARTFKPAPGTNTVTRPAQLRQELRASTLGSLPASIELWLGRAGQSPARIATLTVQPAELTLDFPDPTDPNDERWWSDWQKAVDAGVAAEVDLGPASPSDIDVLYAVGLGSDSPGVLLEAHRDVGDLAVLQPGTPTNTVDGEPAADLGRDPESWLPLITSPPPPQPAATEIGLSLTGADNLAPLRGGDVDTRPVNQDLVAALWPALWGHMMKDVWGFGAAAHDLALWARENMLPEGPLPPIRIGTQPYGLLPVTALRRWQPAAGDPALEAAILPSLITAMDDWAAAGARSGSVVDATTEQLLETLGRRASSKAYAYRPFVSLELVQLLGWAFGPGATAQDLVTWWEQTCAAVRRYPLKLLRRYATLGWPQDVQIPLVEPTNLPAGTTLGEVLRRLVQASPSTLTSRAGLGDLLRSNQLPDSLLIRLVIFSLLLSAAEVTRAEQNRLDAALEPIASDASQPTQLALDARALVPQAIAPSPAATVYGNVRQAVLSLSKFTDIALLERVLRATIDSATHRIDPWLTGFAWRRLRKLRTAATFAAGVYGWVDEPFRGTPGPTAGGLLHAPSDAQALAAVILRDKAIHDPQAGRWDMTLHSSSIRLARQLADEVRAGASIQEALGREIERSVGDPVAIAALRKQFPVRAEHAGRRVCDGQQVLAAPPANVPLSTGQLQALEPLRAAVDAYGDLLVLDGVFDVVSGRADQAGAAMDAAAGLGAPPNLDALRTPRHGRAVNTSVVVALPWTDRPTTVDEHTSPGRIADPSAAAFFDTVFGSAGSSSWHWRIDDQATTTDVHLADLDLAPVDTLSLATGYLERLARALAGAPDSASITQSEGSETIDRLKRLVDVLGGMPALPEHLADDGSRPDASALQAELATRYQTLRGVGESLRTSLQTLAANAVLTQGQAATALLDAARWGITPLTADAPDPATQVRRAAEALDERLQAAPAAADAPTFPPERLGRMIAELASPEGRIAVLGRIVVADVPASLTAETTSAVDTDWLTVVAPVRMPLARLEAHQLEAAPPFAVWTNRPGDPWQANEPADANGDVPETRFVAVYGLASTVDPDPANPQKAAAVGLLDAWGETVPVDAQTTTAAFGFNAPAARAPQAILIAVPPVETQQLTTQGLLDIVTEARDLTRVRAARPPDLDAFSGALPSAFLPASGETAVVLT
jgi:hypothetical protein